MKYDGIVCYAIEITSGRRDGGNGSGWLRLEVGTNLQEAITLFGRIRAAVPVDDDGRGIGGHVALLGITNRAEQRSVILQQGTLSGSESDG